MECDSEALRRNHFWGCGEGDSASADLSVRFLGCERTIANASASRRELALLQAVHFLWMWEGVSVALRRNRFFGVIGAIACNNVRITASKI